MHRSLCGAGATWVKAMGGAAVGRRELMAWCGVLDHMRRGVKRSRQV